MKRHKLLIKFTSRMRMGFIRHMADIFIKLKRATKRYSLSDKHIRTNLFLVSCSPAELASASVGCCKFKFYFHSLINFLEHNNCILFFITKSLENTDVFNCSNGSVVKKIKNIYTSFNFLI